MKQEEEVKVVFTKQEIVDVIGYSAFRTIRDNYNLDNYEWSVRFSLDYKDEVSGAAVIGRKKDNEK